MTPTTRAELAGLVARHTAEIARLERAADELRGYVPVSLIAAIEGAASASLALVVEAQRVRGGVQS